MVEEFTSSCPKLRELDLWCFNVDRLLRVSITNPLTTKLSIADERWSIGTGVEICAPYLTTLIISYELRRHYKWKVVPSLSTVRIAWVEFYIFRFFDDQRLKLMEILSSVHTREFYLCSECIRVCTYFTTILCNRLSTYLLCLNLGINKAYYRL